MATKSRLAILREFREFAVKGNVVDLAVGIVIGAAFSSIVKSLVDDIIMPVAGMALGGVDFVNRYWVLKGRDGLAGNETLPQARAEGAVVVGYGQFLNSILTFVIVAWAVFLLVKAINKLRREKPAAPPATKECPECAENIPLKAKRCGRCGTSPLA